MYALLKLVMGIFLLGTGGYAYYALFFTYQPKVANCVVLGSIALIWGIVNLKNWKKGGALRKLDVIYSNKINNMFKRTNATRPEPSTQTPEPAFELTNEEKRRIIKERQQEKGAWKTPEVEVIPPEKAEPYLLRPAVGSQQQKPIVNVEAEGNTEPLSLDQIQDLLKRG